MDIKKNRFNIIVLVSILVSLFSCYSTYKINIGIANLKWLIQMKISMDLRIVDCKLVDFDIIDEEATYSIKKGHNTNAIIKYLNSEGYEISIKEKGNKAKDLIEFQKDYRAKNKIKEQHSPSDIRDKICKDMTEAGYRWIY